jgi:predicted RNA-binding Zn-ribbon protein involved in translation (DUF1610 family)
MKGLDFDSSLSNIDATVSPIEYRERLLSLLQPILEHRFPGNSGKQKIRPYKDRISFACPYCGDSMKSNYKKRGNFILSGKHVHHFKCFNCGEFKRIDKFFEDYNTTLDLSVINYIANNLVDFSSYADVKSDMSLFVDMGAIDKYAIDRQEFLKSFGLTEVKESPVWSWLKNRLQYDDKKFAYNPRKNYLAILNLTPSGKILGVQKRLFKGDNKYLTYKLGKLYELLKKDPKIIPDEIDNISQLFNICLTNYSKPITLFEGPFDAFLFKNSIANTGANKAFPLDIPIRYWYDDDETGRHKSIQKINDGDEVFLWTKLKNDFELPVRKKWDLNDVLIYFRDKNIKTPNFNDYFSDDELDIIDI